MIPGLFPGVEGYGDFISKQLDSATSFTSFDTVRIIDAL